MKTAVEKWLEAKAGAGFEVCRLFWQMWTCAVLSIYSSNGDEVSEQTPLAAKPCKYPLEEGVSTVEPPARA
jgi:hypothetical protein